MRLFVNIVLAIVLGVFVALMVGIGAAWFLAGVTV